MEEISEAAGYSRDFVFPESEAWRLSALADLLRNTTAVRRPADLARLTGSEWREST
jgi:hypothetical protein